MTELLTDRYEERLAGTLSCHNWVVITGTLPGACYAAGMTSSLNAKHIRKEDIVAQVIKVRADHPGLVHVISAMEACNAYEPWHDKRTDRAFLRPNLGQVPALLTGSTRPSVWSTCAPPPGARSGCSSTARVSACLTPGTDR